MQYQKIILSVFHHSDNLHKLSEITFINFTDATSTLQMHTKYTFTNMSNHCYLKASLFNSKDVTKYTYMAAYVCELTSICSRLSYVPVTH